MIAGASRVIVMAGKLQNGQPVPIGTPSTIRAGFDSDAAVGGSVGEVLRAALAALEIPLGDSLKKRLGDYLSPTRKAAAWTLWCEGVAAAQSGRSKDLAIATQKLDAAVEEDPFFPLAYLKLAEYWAEVAQLRALAGGASEAAWGAVYANARKVANLRPDAGDPQWRLALGYSAGPRTDREKMSEAMALAEQRLPGEPATWHTKWVVGGRDPADPALQRAMALDPHPARYNIELAAELSRRAKLTEAEAQIEKALTLAPHSAMLSTVRGDTAMRRAKSAQAREFYEQALEYDPGFVAALVRLAELDAREKRPTESFNNYLKVVEADPTHPAAHYRLAYHYQRTGRMSEAIHHYQQALLGMPTNVGLYVNLAQAYQAAGFLDQTVRHYQLALEIDPTNLQAQLELSALYYQAGDLTTAIALLEKAAAGHPDSAEAHFHLAAALATQRQYEQAIPHYRRAIEIQPENAGAHHNLGLILLQQGDTAGAKQHLGRACKLGQREACQALQSYEQYTAPRPGAPGVGGQ
ncbi:MAG: tetratricopeptide repeat protein [Chrysiogenetes bacterium]|nr:tetratricopeptide repeat protein [Chrysiogenetes bacterium]